MSREGGAAIAVLSIYVLMLLVPLHQSAATQREFAELGYESFGVWSICTATKNADGTSDPAGFVKCPVTGTGKGDLLFASATISGPAIFVAGTALAIFSSNPPARYAHPGVHPRAPPLPV